MKPIPTHERHNQHQAPPKKGVPQMPRGFIGNPATSYLIQATQAHGRATNSGKQISESAPSRTTVRERRLPFEPAEGNTAITASAGRGNSSNIVVSQHQYEFIAQRISLADDRLGECIFNLTQEIEALCQTVFRLPAAVPRCLNISESVKRSLSEFRGVTEDTALIARRLAREINDI